MLEIGSSLREARRDRGLDLADVEASTLIRRRYLEALENDQFDALPAGSYRRSFLREYAEFLELDGDAYAREYDLRSAAQEPVPPNPPPHPGFELARPLGERPLTPVIALAAIALAGLAVWQLGGSGGTGVAQATRPTTQMHPPPQTRQPATTTTVAAAATTTATHPSPRRPPPSLTLTATHGSCWLSVRIGSAAGRVVYEQTLQQGQAVRFGLRKPLWIRLGAPTNLEATIGSRRVTAALPTQTGNLIATSSGLRPGS